jgi:small-conductance mechanosensitive channel/CRP-like cAMP-binding protein
MSIMNIGPLLSLILSISLLLIALIVARLRPSWPLWLRGIWSLTIFVLLTLLLQQLVGSPLEPNFTRVSPDRAFWERLVEAGWWLLCAQNVIGVVKLFVVLEHRPRETRIISDLLAGAVYIAAFLAIVNFAFAVPIRGLLATSGVIAIVLGLALQSTLADVFSGIAVGIERPFTPGDLLWVEGGIEGRVIQVNWRSTQIVTGQNNIAAVPNNIIAKAQLINRSRPTPVRQDQIEIRLDAAAPPDTCLHVLRTAVKVCRLLMHLPAPGVVCTGLHGDGNSYEVSFSVETSEQLAAARTELYSHIHCHLRYAGIALAVAGTASVRPVTVPTPSQLLELSELFSVIEPTERDLLAQYLTLVWLEPGETLIRQGEKPERLYIVASGAAEITVQRPTGPHVVYLLGPGETLGAMGLITQMPYSATATAMTQLKAYSLSKTAIAKAIEVMPKLAVGLEALAKRGQAALQQDAAAPEGHELSHPEMFLSRLRSFLKVLAK